MSENVVVIIDDDRGFVLALSKYLHRRGFRAIGSFCGEDGLARLENSGARVAIIDLHLPDLSGIEVVERLRAAGQDTPCVLVSADDQPEVQEQSLSAGAFRFLAKPLSPDDLMCAIADALDPEHPKGHALLVRERSRDRPRTGS